jgi:hypothetical protein
VIATVGAPPGRMPNNGRYGWYKDHEGREWQRVSTLIKKVETDTYNLDQWKLRQVAEGLAVRDDLVLAVKAMGRPSDRPDGQWSSEDRAKLRDIVKAAMEAAKERDGGRVGTAVHDLTERIDRGEALASVLRGLPAPAAADLDAYAALIKLNHWRSVEIERTVVCDELDVAGTIDRVYEIPGLTDILGEWVCQHGHDHGMGNSSVIGDVKTENDPTKNGLHIGPQEGIYSRALRMWLPTPEYVPAPCVRQDVGVVVHVRNGQAIPLFINLREGWEAAQAARAQADRERRAKRDFGSAGSWFAPVPGIVERNPVAAKLDALTAGAVAADYGNPARPGPGQVGEVVTVAGIDFTRLVSAEDAPSAIVAGGTTQCANCAPLVAKASATRVDGTEHNAPCAACGQLCPSPYAPTEQVAVTRPDGMTEWQPTSLAEQYPGEDAQRRKMLIDAIWQATELDHLARLWRAAERENVPWTGPVEMAGNARRRQIECVQRALHTGTDPGRDKCACGWMPGVPA